MYKKALSCFWTVEELDLSRDVVHWNEKPLRVLLIWVWASREVLKSRLDSRVEKMIERGLFDEIRQLRSVASASSTSHKEGQEVKEDFKNVMTKGAKEWEKWCKKFEEDPEKAMKK